VSSEAAVSFSLVFWEVSWLSFTWVIFLPKRFARVLFSSAESNQDLKVVLMELSENYENQLSVPVALFAAFVRCLPTYLALSKCLFAESIDQYFGKWQLCRTKYSKLLDCFLIYSLFDLWYRKVLFITNMFVCWIYFCFVSKDNQKRITYRFPQKRVQLFGNIVIQQIFLLQSSYLIKKQIN